MGASWIGDDAQCILPLLKHSIYEDISWTCFVSIDRDRSGDSTLHINAPERNLKSNIASLASFAAWCNPDLLHISIWCAGRAAVQNLLNRPERLRSIMGAPSDLATESLS